MNPDQDTRQQWRTLVNDLGHILGHEQALLFLGCILARPLYPMLRREFGMVPGVFLHGGRACGKSYLGEVAASLITRDTGNVPMIDAANFHWKLFRNCLSAKHDGIPPIVDCWADEPPSYNKVTDLCMSMGMDPSTTIGDQRITFHTPAVILGPDPSRQENLASRCLHFAPHKGARPHRNRPVSGQRHLHRLTEQLAKEAGWEGAALAFIQAAANKVATCVKGRPATLLRIAWAVAVTADALLDGEEPKGKVLGRWIDKHAALLFPTCTLA